MPAKVFSLEISVKVFHLIHPVLIDNLFHVRDTIFVQSSAVQCGDLLFSNKEKSPGLGQKTNKHLFNQA